MADRAELIAILSHLNYYRLSAYLYPYRANNGSESFKPGTEIDAVLQVYRFDEQLRNVLVAGLERVEVSFRTSLAYECSHSFGPFGYVEATNLPDCSRGDLVKLLAKITEEKDKSSEQFKEHFCDKYGDKHPFLPIWMAVELMSFGTLNSLLRGLDHRIRQKIASRYSIDQVVLTSWFLALNALRNLCAHHSRIWNRIFGVKPRIPHKDILWIKPFSIPNDRVFGLASVLAYLSARIGDADAWRWRFVGLMSGRPAGAPLVSMGFPEGWEKHPIWN